MTKCVVYLGFINTFSFLLFEFDKYCARNGRWRVPESTLLGIALLGGSIGAYLGMLVFHHKTRKKKFAVGLPLIIVLQAALTLTTLHELGIFF